MILSVLVGIWAEPRDNRHADLCLFTLGGRQVVRSCEVGFKTQKGVSGDGQQTTKWKVTDFKLKEYQAAKIHKNETTVETGKSRFLVTSLQSRRATLAGPCCPWECLSEPHSKSTIILTETCCTYLWVFNLFDIASASGEHIDSAEQS